MRPRWWSSRPSLSRVPGFLGVGLLILSAGDAVGQAPAQPKSSVDMDRSRTSAGRQPRPASTQGRTLGILSSAAPPARCGWKTDQSPHEFSARAGALTFRSSSYLSPTTYASSAERPRSAAGAAQPVSRRETPTGGAAIRLLQRVVSRHARSYVVARCERAIL